MHRAKSKSKTIKKHYQHKSNGTIWTKCSICFNHLISSLNGCGIYLEFDWIFISLVFPSIIHRLYFTHPTIFSIGDCWMRRHINVSVLTFNSNLNSNSILFFLFDSKPSLHIDQIHCGYHCGKKKYSRGMKSNLNDRSG